MKWVKKNEKWEKWIGQKKNMKIVKNDENGWEGTKVEWGGICFLTNVERNVEEIGMDGKRK